MEIGNVIQLKPNWREGTDSYVTLAVVDCLMACKRFKLSPVGRFEMKIATDIWGNDAMIWTFEEGT